MPAPRDHVDAVTDAVVAVGGKFMRGPIVDEHAARIGLKSLAFGFAGRAGVLGDVDADVVTSVLAFFSPAVVERWWNEARSVVPPRVAAEHYAEACAAFGRAKLQAIDGLDRLVDIGEAVIADAQIIGVPLFAAWRRSWRAVDTAGHAAQVLHILREHRGSNHVLAIAASGLTALEAIVVSGGEARARQLGFAGDLPDPAPRRRRWEQAEAITRQRTAQAYAGLTPVELVAFGELLEACGKAFGD
jgi:hypothetical protein